MSNQKVSEKAVKTVKTVKAEKAVKKYSKAVAHAGQRKKVESKAISNTLPLLLEKARLEALHQLQGVDLNATFTVPKSGEVTVFGHKVASKAAACDRMVAAALSGDYNIQALVKALVNHDSAYGRRDNAEALVKRVHDHCAIKRNGCGYYGSSLHATRPHQLTADQRKALDRFAGELALPVKSAIKSAISAK